MCFFPPVTHAEIQSPPLLFSPSDCRESVHVKHRLRRHFKLFEAPRGNKRIVHYVKQYSRVKTN